VRGRWYGVRGLLLVKIEQNGEFGAGEVLAGCLQDGVEQGAADLLVEADQQVEPDGGVGLTDPVEARMSVPV
jgi:hypothetical protein